MRAIILRLDTEECTCDQIVGWCGARRTPAEGGNRWRGEARPDARQTGRRPQTPRLVTRLPHAPPHPSPSVNVYCRTPEQLTDRWCSQRTAGLGSERYFGRCRRRTEEKITRRLLYVY